MCYIILSTESKLSLLCNHHFWVYVTMTEECRENRRLSSPPPPPPLLSLREPGLLTNLPGNGLSLLEASLPVFSTGPQAPHHLASVPNIQENPFALWWTRERLTRSSVRGSLPSPTPLSTAGHVPRHGPRSPSLPHSSHWSPRLPPDPPSTRASPCCLHALSL